MDSEADLQSAGDIEGLASNDLVAAAKRGFDAFNRRDTEGMLEGLDPEVEWIPFRSALEGTIYHGHAGVRRNLRETFEDWEEVAMEAESFHLVGHYVLALGQVRAKPPDGPETVAPVGWVFTERDGSVIRVQMFLDQETALKAVGLKPEDLERTRS